LCQEKSKSWELSLFILFECLFQTTNFIIKQSLTYRNSSRGDQVEELPKCYGRTIAIADKWIVCLVQWCVNCNIFCKYEHLVIFHYSIVDLFIKFGCPVMVLLLKSSSKVLQKVFISSTNYLCWLIYCFQYILWSIIYKFRIILRTHIQPLLGVAWSIGLFNFHLRLTIRLWVVSHTEI
jgi:hypothetical protein